MPTVVIEPMRRDSGPALAAAAALARSSDPDAVVLALAADHVILDVEEFRATCARRPQGGGGRAHRHLRHHAERAQDQLRLHPPRQADRLGRGLCRRSIRRKARTPKPRRAMSPRAICGIRAISCFAPTCCWRSLKRYEPAMAAAVEAAVAGASNDLGFVRLEPDGVRQRAAEVDRLCGDGEDRTRRRDRRQIPLVGHRLLGRDLRYRRARQVRQRDPWRRGDGGRAQLRRPFGRPAHRRARRRRPRGRVDGRCGAGGAARARPGGARTGRQAQERSGRRRPSIAAGIGPGAITIPSTAASASRSNASSCSRAARCRCKSITIVPSTGWWCAAPPRSPSARTSNPCTRTSSIYIPIGAVHRLANRGKIPLELIEVQTGSYLGEDDIVRIDDVYKRSWIDRARRAQATHKPKKVSRRCPDLARSIAACPACPPTPLSRPAALS